MIWARQVTTAVNDANNTSTFKPALGESWAHACNVQLMLQWINGCRVARLYKGGAPGVVPYQARAVVATLHPRHPDSRAVVTTFELLPTTHCFAGHRGGYAICTTRGSTYYILLTTYYLLPTIHCRSQGRVYDLHHEGKSARADRKMGLRPHALQCAK